MRATSCSSCTCTSDIACNRRKLNRLGCSSTPSKGLRITDTSPASTYHRRCACSRISDIGCSRRSASRPSRSAATSARRRTLVIFQVLFDDLCSRLSGRIGSFGYPNALQAHSGCKRACNRPSRRSWHHMRDSSSSRRTDFRSFRGDAERASRRMRDI